MKYKIFVLTILASVGFFNYRGMIPEQVIKMMFFLAIFIGLFYSLYHGKSLRDNKYPRIPYFYLLFGIAFSSVMATLTHMQGLGISFMTNAQYLIPYLYLFIYLKLNMATKKVMSIYIVLCGISAVVYFCNVLTMPFNIFGEPILDEDITRGIIRIPVTFIEVFPVLVFYSVNRWYETKEKKWFILIGGATLMIFLSVTRQIIAITGVLAVISIFRNISWFKKIIMAVVVGLIVGFVLPQVPIYKTMIELSEDQRDENDDEENIRIQAWRYYTYENQESPLNVIFGNGIPSVGNSIWGTAFFSYVETSGLASHDVGWAGFFWYFGILTTIALLILIGMAIMHPKPPELNFLNYWLLFYFITSVASAPILYWYQIVNVMVCIGMVYSPFDLKDEDATGESERAVNASFAQPSVSFSSFRRYPQLLKYIGKSQEESHNDKNA